MRFVRQVVEAQKARRGSGLKGTRRSVASHLPAKAEDVVVKRLVEKGSAGQVEGDQLGRIVPLVWVAR